MNVVIIDDERLARNELRRLLKAHPQMQIVGEADGVAEGLRIIESCRPELVFLDIQMPDGTGFDLLTALDTPPPVIFTTAFDQYAIRAFDVNALDYLLKPIEPERLAKALKKREQDVPAISGKPQAIDGKVFIKDGERCWFVAMEQIALFESEGNYTRVYFDNVHPLLLRSLNQLETRLDPEQFMRISRSHIVNMKFVTKVAPTAIGGLMLTLKNEVKVTMSRRRAAEFKQRNRL